MVAKETIQGISISLEVGENMLLYIFLGDDGTVHRLGNGEREFADRDIYSGNSPDRLFESLMAAVDDEMLAETGSYELPAPKGDACRLVVLFKGEGDQTAGLEFLYGSESEGPPTEIHDLVIRALDLTEPWFADHRRQSPHHPGDPNADSADDADADERD